MIRGIGVVDGIAIGRAVTKKEEKETITLSAIDNVEDEIKRLTDAVERYTIQLEKTHKKAINLFGEEEAEVYQAHLKLLKNSVIVGGVKKQIRDHQRNAEYVLEEVRRKYESIFKRMADDFLKRKAEYIRNITEGIIQQLLGNQSGVFKEFNAPSIIVANQLAGVETMDLDPHFVLGMVLEEGEQSSSSTQFASHLSIPCIVGIKNLNDQIKHGDLLVIDGSKGEVLVNPEEETLSFYQRKIDKDKEFDDNYQQYINEVSETLDHFPLKLGSYTTNASEVKESLDYGPDNIGIYRTDHLFIGRKSAPSEIEQVEDYQRVLSLAGGKEVVFKTFDCSSASDLPYIYTPQEKNPALGYLSTRMMLKQRDLLLTQIKAILRASNPGRPVKLLIPMITSMDELLDIKLIVEDAKIELEAMGIETKVTVDLGIVISVPSVAIMIEHFARDLAFVYIDIDSLIQYMNAADPSNEMTFELYDVFNPGIIKVIHRVIYGAHREGAAVCVFGEQILNELMFPLYIAMGCDRLCLPAKQIPKYRHYIRNMVKTEWEKDIIEVKKYGSGNQIKNYLQKRFGDEFIWK